MATEACPKCQATSHRKLPAGSRVRVECHGCGRLVRWEQPISRPESQTGQQQSLLITPPEVWLYTSRRLELLTLPASPLLGPTLTLGDVTYYRATPAVLRWLLAAQGPLDAKLRRQLTAGEIGIPESTAQCRDYLAGVEAVQVFVKQVWSAEAVAAELAQPGKPALPDVGRVPDG